MFLVPVTCQRQKAHARGPFAEKPTQERRFCMKKGTGTRKVNDSLLLFRNTGDPVTFSLFGPSPVPAMGLSYPRARGHAGGGESRRHHGKVV